MNLTDFRPDPKVKPTSERRAASTEIMRALRIRSLHYNQIFLTEVTCGRSGSAWEVRRLPGMEVRRMDGLAIQRSWTKIRAIGFEVKVDRGDWRRDDKWEEYLPWVNEFYLVSPVGIIRPDEVESEDVGLIHAFPPPRIGAAWKVRTVKPARNRPFGHPGLPWQLYHTLILNKMGPER